MAEGTYLAYPPDPSHDPRLYRTPARALAPYYSHNGSTQLDNAARLAELAAVAGRLQQDAENEWEGNTKPAVGRGAGGP